MAQQDDTRGFIPGPLDELVPGLRQKRDRLPALPVHPRVLQSPRDGDTQALVLASFAAPGNPRAFHAALKPLVEAALLSELSRPVEELREGRPALSALELFLFSRPEFDVTPALAPFGLAEAPLHDVAARRTLPLLRSEAQFVEGPVSDEPCARYVVSAAPRNETPCPELAQALLAGAKGPFGAEPGGLARRASEFLTHRGYAGVAPTRAGIERLEQLIVPSTPSTLRWIEPLLFQALCDLVAVAAHATWGREVEWGVSEVDPETGVAPPPLIRVHRDGDPIHIPLGEHVLRWCVMPMRAGEEIPSLGAWAEHEFA